MDIQEAFANARFHTLKTVIDALGPERMEKAMTAFDDGESSWSECFFARAFDGEINLNRVKNPEYAIKDALKLPTLIPIRFTWTSFDSCKGTGLNRTQLRDMIKLIQTSDKLTKEMSEFVSSVDFDALKAITIDCAVKPFETQTNKWFNEPKAKL